MKKRYEIRIYNERFNINPNYYQGNEDVKMRIYADSKKSLIQKWIDNLEEYEGETYSVWDGDEILVAGAYDPSDIDIISENL